MSIRKITKQFMAFALAAALISSENVVSFASETQSTSGGLAGITTNEDLDGELPVEDETFAFGTAGIKLKAGEYVLPVSLKNASNPTADSGAAGCLKSDAALVVKSDGSAEVTLYLQAVNMGGATAWASDWKIYPDYTDKEQTIDAAPVTNEDGKVESITYTIPDITADGTYVNMYVDLMQRSPDAYVEYGYASLQDETEIYNGTFHMEQFGEYDINTAVSVKGNLITGVEITGANFGGTYADTNRSKLQSAIDGLKDAFTGKKADDAEAVYSIDTVSGATYSSNGIRDSVMDALSLEHSEETITLPAEKLAAGEYEVDISFYTDAVMHYITGEEKTKAKILADEDGNMILTTPISNGTDKEPLFITDFSGYYLENDTAKGLSSENLRVTKDDIDYTDAYFEEGTQVVTQVSFPLEGNFAEIYTANLRLYVPAMNNLNGTFGGVNFENGWFYIDCYAKIFWDGIRKTEPTGGDPVFGTEGIVLEAGTYTLPISMKNAAKPETDSMAGSCLNGASLVVDGDGNASVVLDLTSVSVMGQTGWASQWKVYQSGISSNTVDAAVTETDTDGHVTQITFAIPDYSADGVYVNMLVDLMGNTVDAYLVFDYANANKIEDNGSLENGIYAVTGQMLKVDLAAASMSDAAINKTMKLTVQDGKATLAMDFHGMKISGIQGYLSSLKYFDTGYTKDANGNPVGTLKDATVESFQKYSDGTVISDDYGKDYPDVVTFALIPEALEDGLVPLQVFVPIMESITAGTGSQNVYLKLDMDSLRKTTALDAAFGETEAAPENPNAVSKPQTPPPANVNTENTPPAGNTDTVDTALKVGQSVNVKGHTYKVTAAGKVAFTKCKANAKSVAIPASIKVNNVTYKVAGVAKNAFKNNKKLTKVTLGKNVTKVGKNAFKGCTKLKTVNLPKGLSKSKKASLKKQLKKTGISSSVKMK